METANELMEKLCAEMGLDPRFVTGIYIYMVPEEPVTVQVEILPSNKIAEILYDDFKGGTKNLVKPL